MFVRSIGVGVKKADRHRFNLLLPQSFSQGVEFPNRRLDEHPSVSCGPLSDLKGQPPGNGRIRELDLQVVHVVAVLVPD